MGGDSGKEIPHVVRAVMQILIMRSKKVMDDKDWASLLELETHISEMADTAKWNNMKILSHGAWTFSGTQLMFNVEDAEHMLSRVWF
jgi:hypothetical protein